MGRVEEVAKLVNKGLNIEDIAKKLDIDPVTVKGYVLRAWDKGLLKRKVDDWDKY